MPASSTLSRPTIGFARKLASFRLSGTPPATSAYASPPGGEEALITGDFIHHPCQIARPEWSSTADSDAAEARLTRERMLTHLADTPILVIGTHFAGRTAGRIV